MKKLQRLVKNARQLQTKLRKKRVKDKIYWKNREELQEIFHEIIDEALFLKAEALYELEKLDRDLL